MRDFRASSRKGLICRGLRNFLGGIMVIFDGVKSGEMLDFSGFYRMGYRSKNGGLGVETSDMPFPSIEHSLQNVNYAPSLKFAVLYGNANFLFLGLIARTQAASGSC